MLPGFLRFRRHEVINRSRAKGRPIHSVTAIVLSMRVSAEEPPTMMLTVPGSTTKLCLPASQYVRSAAFSGNRTVRVSFGGSVTRWKSAQFLDRPLHRGIDVLDVHLHHLVAGASPPCS